MTDHLPECPWFPHTHEVLSCRDRETGFSFCEVIAKVREDERKKAHSVIDRFDMFSDDRDAMHAWIDGTPPDWWTETPNG